MVLGDMIGTSKRSPEKSAAYFLLPAEVFAKYCPSSHRKNRKTDQWI